ncbi:pilus assembly protein, partial [bacterium]|nr:pilus assembly protein [bacterium]
MGEGDGGDGFLEICPVHAAVCAQIGRNAPRVVCPGIRTVRDNRGSTTVELVLLAPMFVLVLVFVTGLGRIVELKLTVRSAAESAARASSLVTEQRMSEVG